MNLILDGRAFLYQMPKGYGHQSTNRAWLYAAGLSEGLVKVGKTSKPKERLIKHWRDNGRSLHWAHLFGPIRCQRTALRVEKSALAKLSSLSAPLDGKKEVFADLSKAEVLRLVRMAYAEAG